MRRLISIGITLVLLTAGDLAVRAWASREVEDRAQHEVPEQVFVDASVGRFPFVPPLLLFGRVSQVRARFSNVPAGRIAFASIELTLRNVDIDRGVLLRERRVELVDIGEGVVTAELNADALTSAFGGSVGVEIRGGEVFIAGRQVPASVRIADNALVVEVAGFSRRVDIPVTSLLPCVTDVTVLSGRLRLTCVIREIPPGLYRRSLN